MKIKESTEADDELRHRRHSIWVDWATTTHTYSDLDVTKQYDILVQGHNGTLNGDRGHANDVSPLTDTTAPTVSGASVSGKTLTVTFDENLNTGSAPAGSAFSVSATPSGGTARTIDGTGTVAARRQQGDGDLWPARSPKARR